MAKHAKTKTNTPLDRKDDDQPCSQRRRLLTFLGTGIATAYVAPALLGMSEAQARDWRRERGKRGSFSSGSYRHGRRRHKRGSYSRGSGYNKHRRSRVREYTEDPILILEDVIFGPPRR